MSESKNSMVTRATNILAVVTETTFPPLSRHQLSLTSLNKLSLHLRMYLLSDIWYPSQPYHCWILSWFTEFNDFSEKTFRKNSNVSIYLKLNLNFDRSKVCTFVSLLDKLLALLSTFACLDN